MFSPALISATVGAAGFAIVSTSHQWSLPFASFFAGVIGAAMSVLLLLGSGAAAVVRPGGLRGRVSVDGHAVLVAVGDTTRGGADLHASVDAVGLLLRRHVSPPSTYMCASSTA